jgi:hypothetical protein
VAEERGARATLVEAAMEDATAELARVEAAERRKLDEARAGGAARVRAAHAARVGLRRIVALHDCSST